MKRTLITLLSLAGVAMAGVDGDWTATFTTTDQSKDQTWDDYSAAFPSGPLTLKITGWTMENTAAPNMANGTYTQAAPGGASVDSIRPNANVGNGATYTLNFTLTNTNTVEAIDVTGISFAVFTYDASGNFHDKATRPITLALDGGLVGTQDVSMVSPAYATNNALVDNTTEVSITLNQPVYVAAGGQLEFTLKVSEKDSNGTFVGLKGATFSIIPEPATATLSLLALCGLAARRRRASR